jgi:hypothetical protein
MARPGYAKGAGPCVRASCTTCLEQGRRGFQYAKLVRPDADFEPWPGESPYRDYVAFCLRCKERGIESRLIDHYNWLPG